MVLFRKNRLLNEILFIGSLIYLFILLTHSLRIAENTSILPNKLTIFEILKNYFISVSILIVIEYFIAFDLPQNYLLSRVFSFFVMCTITLVLFNLYSKTWVFESIIAVNIIYIASIISGSIAAYYIQRVKLQRSLVVGIINYVVIAGLFIVLTFISPVGYIFEV